jgi:hypothetical protein
MPRQLIVPDDISSASEDLGKQRNRDLDVSLKELDRVFEQKRNGRTVWSRFSGYRNINTVSNRLS